MRAVNDAVAQALGATQSTAGPRWPVAAAENGRTAPTGLLTPREVGARIGRSAEWVRDHRGEFEQVRLSDGERPRLLFVEASVAVWLEECAVKPTPATASETPAGPVRRRRSAKRTAGGAELLPIRG